MAKATLPRDDVGILARWVHEAALRAAGLPPEVSPWVKLPRCRKEHCRQFARELLENPPPVLRKAVRRLEGG